MATLIAAANFALSLLKLNNIAESFVFSPFSLSAALSIILLGAGGNTRDEMTQVLLKGSTSNGVVSHYSTLIEQLDVENGQNITIEVASQFFVRNGINLLKCYKKEVQENFNVSVQNLSFDSPSPAARAVNGFVDEKTHGMIPTIVTEDIFTPDLMAILINAVYFKGLWETPFSKNDSKPKQFHATNGNRMETFMIKNDLDVMLNFNNNDVQAIALPYKNDDFRMWFFLPKQGLSLQKWLNDTNGTSLVNIMNGATRSKCNVEIPKFKIESEMKVRDQLETLGMKQVFSNNADLSKITNDTSLKVSQVIHKAVIEVNEEGAEAAAATAVIMVKMLAIKPKLSFVADRPFAYAITSKNNILFLGVYQ